MARENGLRFKLVYSNWHSIDRHSFPMPNGLHSTYVDYLRNLADQKGEMILLNQFRSHEEIDRTFQKPKSANVFRHSNFVGYFSRIYGRESLVKDSDVVLDDDLIYLYPYELEMSAARIAAEGTEIESNGIQYNYNIEDVISPLSLDLMRKGKLKVIFSNIVDPCHSQDYCEKITQRFVNVGVDAKNVIFIQGNIPNYYFEYNDNNHGVYLRSILSIVQAAENYNKYPCPTGLGYVSDVVRPNDLDVNKIRSKKFLCFNRSMNRGHRLGIFRLALKHNLLDSSIFSFVTNLNKDNFRNDLIAYCDQDDDVDYYADKIYQLMPYELDTQHLTDDEKQSFQTVDLNKKEYYENTYIHIVSETQFSSELNAFISEKTWRPILNLQPFVYIGNYKALETLKDLGFKTFHPLINEDYDNIINPLDRFKKIEQEIVRLNSMTVNELHNLYYSLKDILLHNQDLISQQQHYNILTELHKLESIYGN